MPGKSGFSQVQSGFLLTQKIGNIGIRGCPHENKNYKQQNVASSWD